MKPYVICHMVSSVDGRILSSRWRPQGVGTGLFERLHELLGGDAWLVGRVTGQEFAKAEAYDARGKIAWGRSDIGGGANGAFLRAGRIDEISLVICPAVDGAKGAPGVFDSSDEDAGAAAPVRSMTLESSQVPDGGAVWLRHRLRSG